MPCLTVHHPEQFREHVRQRVQRVFDGADSSSAVSIVSIVVVNLEKGVYNYAVQEATNNRVVKKWENSAFVQLYVDRLRTLLSNLPAIVPLLQSGEITAPAVAKMTHQEFRPDRWKDLMDQKMKRDASKLTGDVVEASTDMYTCKKCKSKRCTYYEMQTRSADEPATVFITCLDCGKRWRN
jgi:DNA-directed RNA polymerase subunit M/transcription elongation factor TFIIS